MRHGADWYKREPLAYLGGVQGMTARHHAVYSVTLELIYVHGGSVHNDPRWISGWIADMGSSAVRTAIAELIEMGKLFIDAEGNLSQNRAKTEAKTRENLRETAQKNGKKGGEKSAEIRAVAREINDLSQPPATPENQADKIREDKRREEEKKEAREDALFHLERVVPHDLAVAFVAHRKALKAPMTAYAGKLMAKKLATMADPGAAMEASIEAGWRDVFPPKPNIHPFPMKGPTRGERYAALSAELDARLAEQPFD